MNNTTGIGNLPIKPIEITGFIKDKVLLKKYDEEFQKNGLKSGVEKSLEFKRALVAYVDVLGFSGQREQEEIISILNDFVGPLFLSSKERLNLRFHVFSDNAFIAADSVDAKDLIGSLRYSFSQWSNDGILVRGGISMGSYIEYDSVHLRGADLNFNGALFSGTAVNKAVKMEDSKCGAFLFLDKECADFLQHIHKEPILNIDGNLAISWSDNKNSLFWYTGVSAIRLLILLSANEESNSIISKLINNIRYSLSQDHTGFIFSVILACLSLPSLKPRVRKRACELIGIKEPNHYTNYQKIIQDWLKHDNFLSMKGIAEMDSSLPKTKTKI